MVGVAQWIERQTVALDAGGSNPLTHPFSLSAGDLNGAKMIRSEQAKTYADGRAEAVWEPKPPNPLSSTFCFIRRDLNGAVLVR